MGRETPYNGMSATESHGERTAGSLGAILIAEDNLDDAKLAHRAILQLQLENPVHIVKDGKLTLAYLKGEGEYSDRRKYPFPALLLLDLRMPVMDGFEVLRQLQGDPRYASVPILVVTVNQDRRQLGEAYQLGAKSFLTKPINPNDLKNAIEGLGKDSQLRFKPLAGS
ncbi:MAG TPA: response regulator [Verrucomicrobiae bacterium]|jgi:two-component system response regulator|nr:response regulator [Verrucomicrobiae bacterium]